MHTYVHVYGHTHSHTPRIAAAGNARTHVFPEMQLNKHAVSVVGGDQRRTSQRVHEHSDLLGFEPEVSEKSLTARAFERVSASHARRVRYRHASAFSVLTRLSRPLKSGVLICKSSHARSLAHCARAHALLHTHTHKHTNTRHIPTWDYIHSSRCSSISVGQAGSTLLCVIFSQRL